VHVEGGADPARDIEIINLELALADIELVQRRIDKAQKLAKGDKKYLAEAELFTSLKGHLDQGRQARSFPGEIPEDASLLSRKPVLYCANLSEEGFSVRESNPHYAAVTRIAREEGSAVLPICAKLEQDIAEMDAEEKALFLSEIGLLQSGLDRLIQASYDMLGLISYLTAGPQESRAWTIEKGTKAPQAAGKIHSDFERGFIRAEVISYDELISCGSMAQAKEKGLVRSEGKEYVFQDGDVVLFRFNV
jgi:GTP-binding protein YchF